MIQVIVRVYQLRQSRVSVHVYVDVSMRSD